MCVVICKFVRFLCMFYFWCCNMCCFFYCSNNFAMLGWHLCNMLIYNILGICYSKGRVAPNDFHYKFCSCPHELVFTPHFRIIVVEVLYIYINIYIYDNTSGGDYIFIYLYIKNLGGCYVLCTATCLETVDGERDVDALCRTLLL